MGITEVVIVAGALALTIKAWHSRRWSNDTPAPDETNHSAVIAERIARLFLSINPRGIKEPYSPLTAGAAQELAYGSFVELDAIIQYGYDTNIFDAVHVRLIIKTLRDITEMGEFLRFGKRALASSCVYDRMLACGIPTDLRAEGLVRYRSLIDSNTGKV